MHVCVCACSRIINADSSLVGKLVRLSGAGVIAIAPQIHTHTPQIH